MGHHHQGEVHHSHHSAKKADVKSTGDCQIVADRNVEVHQRKILVGPVGDCLVNPSRLVFHNRQGSGP